MYSLEELQKIVHDEINLKSSDLALKKPEELYSPVVYSLAMGGKRLRPLLLLMGYNIFSEDIKNAIPAALAMEVFHNFTLLHDDIMDRSKMRRNKPAVHVKFSENSAILSGDAMVFLSYKYLMESKSDKLPDALHLMTETALEICAGQQYDMVFETRTDVTGDEYIEMIRLKTAVLLGCCLKTGALLAGAGTEIANQLYTLGCDLGIAFQLQDDFLDTFGDQKAFGKIIGGDIAANKKTYLLIKALELAKGRMKEDLLNWLNAGREEAAEKIKAVTEIYNKLDIESITKMKIDSYYENAYKLLKNMSLGEEQKQYLNTFIHNIRNRKY
ncbi:MAG: polyprenyl synthetase family protein [Prolixibacteraceae bacterium]|nr:polyprenyl synthetase family protein [Prolixibacteraceae bacterium]